MMQQLQPGDVLTDLEGYDVGSGAVVMSVQSDPQRHSCAVELFLLDSQETLSVDLGDRAFSLAPEVVDEISQYSYDVMRLDSPELERDIRTLPKQFGPQDPNGPSTLTDVTWRPTDYWNRYQNRYWYSQRRRNQPMREYTIEGQLYRETLDPAQPVQRPAASPRSAKALSPHWPMPRLHLERWADGDDKERDLLRDLAVDFYRGYAGYRTSFMSERGTRDNLTVADYGLIYRRHVGMSDAEMMRLFGFMESTGLIKHGQGALYRDLVNSYEVHRRNRID